MDSADVSTCKAAYDSGVGRRLLGLPFLDKLACLFVAGRRIVNVDPSNPLTLRTSAGSSEVAPLRGSSGGIPAEAMQEHAGIKRPCKVVNFFGERASINGVDWVKVSKDVPPDQYVKDGGVVEGWMPTVRPGADGTPVALIKNINAKVEGKTCSIQSKRFHLLPAWPASCVGHSLASRAEGSHCCCEMTPAHVVVGTANQQCIFGCVNTTPCRLQESHQQFLWHY